MTDAGQIARVEEMERALNESRAAVDQMDEALGRFEAAADGLARLSAYYGSIEWSDDRAIDEAGGYPDDLARGVLSEDLAYDLIIESRETALRMLEAATRTLRDL